jgi:hypothetical protein
MKTVTLNVEGISQGQWSTFLLELNLMKKAWKSYGVDVKLKAHSINKIIQKGTTVNDYTRSTRQTSKRVLMELDIIILKDGLYHSILVAENITIDCFDFCDMLRERVTTYLEDRNQHIIKSGPWGGGQFFGCICR